MTSPGAARSRDLQRVHTIDDLERLLTGAGDGPVVLYKHSLTCGSSAYAFEELSIVAQHSTAPVGLIPVQTARRVSNEVASRFGVRHESPQVLIVHGGEVRWHTSHSGVRAGRIQAALETITSP